MPSAKLEGLEAIVLDLVANDLGKIFVVIHVLFIFSHREVEVRSGGTSWIPLWVSFILGVLITMVAFVIVRVSSLAETWPKVVAPLLEVWVVSETVAESRVEADIFEVVLA